MVISKTPVNKLRKPKAKSKKKNPASEHSLYFKDFHEDVFLHALQHKLGPKAAEFYRRLVVDLSPANAKRFFLKHSRYVDEMPLTQIVAISNFSKEELLFLENLSPKSFGRILASFGNYKEGFDAMTRKYGYDIGLFEKYGNTKPNAAFVQDHSFISLGNPKIVSICSKELFSYLCDLNVKSPGVFKYLKYEDLEDIKRLPFARQIERLTTIIKSRMKK